MKPEIRAVQLKIADFFFLLLPAFYKRTQLTDSNILLHEFLSAAMLFFAWLFTGQGTSCGSDRARVTPPQPLRFENLLTRRDPTHEMYNTPLTQPGSTREVLKTSQSDPRAGS